MASIRNASARLLRSSRSLLPKVTTRTFVQNSAPSLRAYKLPTTIIPLQHRGFADQTPSQQAFGGSFNLQPTKKLYVGNLFFEVTAQQLHEMFSPFGPLVNSKIITDFKGFSKGYGFVEFNTIEEATKARDAMDQTVNAGRSLVINYVRPLFVAKDPPKPAEPTSTLFVGNLAYNLTDKELNNLFRPLSNIRDVRVAIDRRTGQPRGFAHADFLDVRSAIAAQKYLNGLEVSGRVLRADYSISGRNQAMMQHTKGEASATGEPGAATEALKDTGYETTNDTTTTATDAAAEQGEIAEVEQGEIAEAETSDESAGVKS